MKKVQDYYFKKAKQENYPARSVYKLEEAQQKYAILKRGDKVLDLGCHPGSWSLYAARVIGSQGMVYGADLQKGGPLAVPGGARIEVLCADICDEQFLSALAPHVPFHVVLSDLAPRTTGHKFSDHLKSVELSRRALYIAARVLRPGGTLYCKIFQGEDFPVFVDEVREFFAQVKIIKPKSSRVESREVFVLGRGFQRAVDAP
ncbi:MAG: SAM-dependent methyltransferase [Thermodesulfobacteriota bacterium]